jgi:hypothetical protein
MIIESFRQDVKPQADFNLVFELPLKNGFRQAEK